MIFMTFMSTSARCWAKFKKVFIIFISHFLFLQFTD
jgi:hypothetical protein